MKKIPVGVLGATGLVGQNFVALLADHPWFDLQVVAASEASVGKEYGQAVSWSLPTPIPPQISSMRLFSCTSSLSCPLLFSALDAAIAESLETRFAKEGHTVVSNTRCHRGASSVPLIIPEVNPEHLALLHEQPLGKIITYPNCVVAGLAIALKPLYEQFELEGVHVVTMQAISGAGLRSSVAKDVQDNVIPFIPGEEEKIETEPLKILGEYKERKIEPAKLAITASCHRVPVNNGHLLSVSLKLKKEASRQEILSAWEQMNQQSPSLPSSPADTIVYFDEENFPQPRLHRDLGDGMTVSVGRLRASSPTDLRFSLLVNNTVRGGAGGAILAAELLMKERVLGQNAPQGTLSCLSS